MRGRVGLVQHSDQEQNEKLDILATAWLCSLVQLRS